MRGGIMSEIPLPEETNSRLIIGGKAIRQIYSTISKYVKFADTIMLVGETGVGKDLIAHEIHRLSPRRDKPYHPVMLSSIPVTLIESDLFGHERGAFTDAKDKKTGIFEQADGGTLYFPEVSEIPDHIQLKLLHFFQYRTFRMVGHHPEKPEICVDVCLIFASNENLDECVKEGKLRRDFYYRINKYSIAVPPLRERRDEIGPLAEQFAYALGKRFIYKEVTLSSEAIDVLKDYHWPGNIRELEGVIERAIVDNTDFIKDGEGKALLCSEHIERFLADNKPEGNTLLSNSFSERHLLPDYDTLMMECEKAYLRELLVQSKGSLADSARIAGFSVKTLRRKLKEHGIDYLDKRR